MSIVTTEAIDAVLEALEPVLWGDRDVRRYPDHIAELHRREGWSSFSERRVAVDRAFAVDALEAAIPHLKIESEAARGDLARQIIFMTKRERKLEDAVHRYAEEGTLLILRMRKLIKELQNNHVGEDVPASWVTERLQEILDKVGPS